MKTNPQSSKHGAPKVFISSTAEDLTACRAAAKLAADHAGFYAEMHEYWPAKDNPPYAECMQRVDGCDVLVVIVAHRYGWEPPDQPVANGEAPKSITWLECERAIGNDADVLAFVVDEKAQWPAELKEDYELTRALKAQGTDTDFNQIARDTARRTQRLAAFTEWLRSRGIRATFTDDKDIRLKVGEALRDWKVEHRAPTAPGAPTGAAPVAAEIPATYLTWLIRTSESVELLGLDVEDAYAPRLSQVYVPAVTAAPADARREAADAPAELLARQRGEDAPTPLLLDRLNQESLYVPGPAGAGKSTFCRWVAWLASAGEMADHPVMPPEAYRETFPQAFAGRLPLLIFLRDFWPVLSRDVGVHEWTRVQLEEALADWVDHRRPGGLTGGVVQACLARGAVLLIFDGVDEVPVSDSAGGGVAYPRDLLLTGLTDALPVWTDAGNRLLLTSRPYGLTATQVKRLGLATAPLEPLPDELQQLFVARWFAAADPERAEEKTDGLLTHIGQRPELGALTDNPILLAALCVRFNQGARLPEDQYWLYHSVVNSVLYNRYPDAARERDPVRRRLAAIALGMHTGSAVGSTRTTPVAEVPESEIDRILQDFAAANRATEGVLNDAAEKRANLLSRSGLLLPRAQGQAAFYHFSFQEFLAAEHLIQTRRDDAAIMQLFRERAAVKEWRATLVFLFSALAFQHRSAQWAVERLTGLTAELSREAVQQNAAPAVFIAECLDIVLSKAWHLGSLGEDFQSICLNAIEDEVALPDRARLAETLARLGDPRSGVGVRDDGLPDIEWVPIPGGKITLEDVEGSFEVAAFEIARYPVTWAQYQAFAEDPEGYSNRDWWQDLEREAQPGEQFHQVPNCPAERVSWYDAMAFCRWLTHRYRKAGLVAQDRIICLPTKWEWQQAATGGDPIKVFPWGAHWKEGRANTRESGLDATTPVGIFPAGASAQGVLDMAGNVSEWCLNKYDNPEDISTGGADWRVLRGGSWGLGQVLARAARRDFFPPGFRFINIGFRLCCVSPIDA